MFRPSLRSLWTLVVMAIFSVGLFYISQTSHRIVKAKHYNKKIESAKLMNNFLSILKEEAIKRNLKIDKTNDPNQTGLIGLNYSEITTSPGIISDKLTALNPNISAAFVSLLKKAKLSKGDYVAVGLTGANPGENLALYAAIKTLKLHPIIISSVGSSQFGANREDFTFLDMESVLYKHKLINFKSVAASLGGGKDIGRGLSSEGRKLIEEAIKRNNVEFIKEKSLDENINKRMKIYLENVPKNKKIKAFINIGTGVTNVGNYLTAKIIKTGVHFNLADKKLPKENVIMKFAMKNTPIIHVYRANDLAKKYDLEIAPESIPKVGVGKIFSSKILNVTVASVCLTILLIIIFVLISIDRKQRHIVNNIIDPDQEL